jgi:hypothetical protein
MVAPAGGATTDLDASVRLAVYRTIVEEGRPPTPVELAGTLGLGVPDVEASLRRLAEEHALVLAPGSPYVWMAPPFSAIPTPFDVAVGERRYFANCIWDALGVPACLHEDATIRTTCPDCAEPLTLEVREDSLGASSGALLHFAIPAARWWEDIGAT